MPYRIRRRRILSRASKTGDIVAPARQQYGNGQAGRACTHHGGVSCRSWGRGPWSSCWHRWWRYSLDDGKVDRIVAGHPVADAVALALVLVVADQRADRGQGVVLKQHPACGIQLVCLEQTDNLGDVSVDGTACWHIGFLQPRQRLASSRTCNAMEFLLLSHRLGTLRCIQYYHYDTPNRCRDTSVKM